jgi:hypothetical protein
MLVYVLSVLLRKMQNIRNLRMRIDRDTRVNTRTTANCSSGDMVAGHVVAKHHLCNEMR